MLNLENKVAVVTGAGKGIGRQIALGLGKAGADIAVADIDYENAKATSDEIIKLGKKSMPIKVDVSNWDDSQNLINTIMENFKKLDILVNNAGINRDAMLHKMTKDQWDEVIKVNLTGAFNCMQPASLIMRNQGYGRIINISSIAWQGNIGQSNYSAAKAGLIGLTKTAARELANKNVTVNAICPGFIDTEMTRGVPEKVWNFIISKIPAGRVGSPVDIANVVAFLASDEASYVTAEVINVGGGLVL